MHSSKLPTSGPGAVLPEGEAAAVRTELETLLADPLFTHSKRCQAFLRYVVERTIEGHGDDLKERTVGVEALGRPADYDTSLDPVVRTTAAEVRKRLAQYYQQHQDSPLRLNLPTGSYVPAVEHRPDHSRSEAPAAAFLRARRRFAVTGFVVLLGVAAGAYMLRASPEPSVLDDFWRPVSTASGTVDLYLGPATAADQAAGTFVTIQAAGALSRVAALLHKRDTPFEIKLERESDFADIRGHSIVTIGLFNNQWTRHINDALRFQLVNGGSSIRDTTQAGTMWTRNPPPPAPQSAIVEDFALVSRVVDARSGQWVVALGGVGPPGTAAAAEFVTSADHLARLIERAPADWRDLNIQVVLTTTVHEGVAGPPRVVASHFWR